MDFEHIISRLAVALGIGLLIGLERGWRTRDAKPGTRAAGVRTFTLCGLLGGVIAAIAQSTGTPTGAGLVLGLGFAVFAVIFAILERDAARAAGSFSATTTVAGLLTFALGAFAVVGDTRIAAGIAVAVTVVLAAREQIHGRIARLTWPELRSALMLLAMTFIILPIVPDTPIGPGEGVNPREVWLIAIVLAGVSFLGYAAVKLFGEERGVLLAAFAGGLVSSTAVTLTNARRAAAGEGATHLLVAGVAIASTVSFLRVIAIVAALKPELIPHVAPALVAAALAAVAYAWATVRWRSGGDAKTPTTADFANPFRFWPVVGFAVMLAIVILLARMVGETFGAEGAVLGAIALGLADVDTVTVSVTRLVPETLGAQGASMAILAAVASNMAAKMAIGVGIGRGHFATELTIVTVFCWFAGGLVFWLARMGGLATLH